MTNTPQNLTASQLDARIIEARHWLNSDSPCFWDQEWCPEATAALPCSRDNAQETETMTTPQTTADAAQIIENKINQETDKLRSRLADANHRHAFAGEGRGQRRTATMRDLYSREIADLQDCVKLMDDAKAMIAAALFETN